MVDERSKFLPFPQIDGFGDELHELSIANLLAIGIFNPLAVEVVLFFGQFKEELLCICPVEVLFWSQALFMLLMDSNGCLT